jgi:transposase
MQRIPVTLTTAQRRALQCFRSKGLHLAREVNRAHILAALDQGVDDAQIASVLGVSRMVIWRTRSAYQEKGLDYALHDIARVGAPPVYSTKDEAAVAALACSPAPAGRKRWTVELLTEATRQHSPELRTVSRETVRRWLKKRFPKRICG